MSSPLFQEAIEGEPFVAPDYDQIQHERDLVDDGRWSHSDSNGYRPLTPGAAELAAIKERMEENGIDTNNPDSLRHAIEGEEIRKLVRRSGFSSLRKVSETRDQAGVVKLTFHEVRTIVERAVAAALDAHDAAVTSG